MNKEQTVQAILDELRQEKTAFLDDLQYSVRQYVQEQGGDCLTLMEYTPDGTFQGRWVLQATGDYIERLVAFTRQETYRGNRLDSVLTEPIIELVVKRFEFFYKSSSPTFARILLQDERIALGLMAGVLAPNVEIDMRARVRDQTTDLIVLELQEQRLQKAGELIETTTDLAVQKTANLVGVLFAQQIQVLILKLVAIPLVNQALALIIQQFIASTVIATIVRFIATRIGTGVAGATFIILLPIMLAWIAYDILNFPYEMGRILGEETRRTLEEHFDDINREVAGRLYDEFQRVDLGQMGKDIAADEGLKTVIEVLFEEDEDE